ncbi:hypothetical protein ANOM_002224 [Aspergillus nomiae NRRL 13137]|uniref:Uncharacterized protein n=1 Tax=Aspergillus nomiae NRRL (strain ATCC 15546 / NRRL 13137 / CBS 260.88 / M93) TaxID=1509407 RepID=A0A0L1JB45_ASPN3|nr:uncharacterized protein ANOM_002224 [Aspergillus nomiae NRRL 13137]KNG88974.1 hypothetical protein ANOM_002224 [Aspergillus nomiae NRRL 13137]
MSAKSSAETPDAWEDDWERRADTLASDPTQPPPEKKVSSKVTKAQRRAQQAEFNRQLWAEAETPQTFHFLESRSNVPLKQEFKPAVTLLSRNPHPSRQSSSVNAAAAGLGRLALNGDNNDDSDDDNKPPEPTPEERHAIALRNREEKQRKYEEVRERLFGSPSGTTSGASSPRSGTPPKQEGRGKGRSRGNGRDNNRDKRDSSVASGKSKQLYDPDSPKPSYVQRKEKQPTNDRNGNDQQSPRQPIRSPRGPDSSGRGGFRFNRGARST